MEQQRAQILSLDTSVNAFNVGVNAGVDAGQTIFHCHVHQGAREMSLSRAVGPAV